MSLEPVLTALLLLASFAEDAPVELGRVRWERDHDAGFAEARRASKPAVLLFQEVPG